MNDNMTGYLCESYSGCVRGHGPKKNKKISWIIPVHENIVTQKTKCHEILQDENFQINILTSRSVIALDSVFVTYSLEMLISTESTAAGSAPMIALTYPIPSRGESQRHRLSMIQKSYTIILPCFQAQGPHTNTRSKY